MTVITSTLTSIDGISNYIKITTIREELTFPHKAFSLEKARAIMTCKVRYATLAATTGPMTVIVAHPAKVGKPHQTSLRPGEHVGTCN